MMKIGVKVVGDIVKDFARSHKNLKIGMTRAFKQGGDGLKNELRGQVRAAGLGAKVERTWRSQVYPKSGISLSPAASVWSKAPHIIRSFDEGTVIKGRDGLWLAIPTENAPRRGVGGKRINPSNFPEGVYGKLRFVYRKRGVALLVVDNVRASYSRKTIGLRGFRPASKTALRTGRGLTTVVMFVLVKQVKVKKKLDFDGSARKWFDRLPSIIDRNIGNVE